MKCTKIMGKWKYFDVNSIIHFTLYFSRHILDCMRSYLPYVRDRVANGGGRGDRGGEGEGGRREKLN